MTIHRSSIGRAFSKEYKLYTKWAFSLHKLCIRRTEGWIITMLRCVCDGELDNKFWRNVSVMEIALILSHPVALH